MKIETFKIKGWKKKETGLVISENDDWVLVKHIPIDYVVDGYKLYRKAFIKSRKSKKQEANIERVLRLKGISKNEPTNFQFGEVLDILKWSEQKYGLFEFQEGDELELFYGKMNTVQGDSFIIDMIQSDGTLDSCTDYEFEIDEVRAIAFETDYFQSIKLLMEDESQKN